MKLSIKKEIIFLELNEVNHQVIKRYSQKSKRFSNLIKNFHIYSTRSYDQVHLSPWITWPTVHRGVNFDKHKIQNLGQDLSYANKKFPNIWESLSKNGKRVGIYGSLHTSLMPDSLQNYDFYVPDPFSEHSQCFPRKLEPIQDFQLKLSRKSSRNVDSSIGGISAISSLIELFRNGLRIKTFFRVIKQLFIEKINRSRLSRRRILQTGINFDMFLKLLKTKKPNFSTFFTNHVASSMHRYWEAAYPEDFKIQSQSYKWRENFKNEINEAMYLTEDLLNDLLVYSESRPFCEIWVCSSMGQSAVDGYEAIEKQLVIKDPFLFIKSLNLDESQFTIRPTMMPRFTFVSSHLKNIKDLSLKLKKLKINGEEIEQMISSNTLTIRLMHWNKEPKIEFNNTIVKIENIGLEMIKINDKSGTSAYHVPEGILMISGKDSSRYVDKGEIPTHEIKELIEDSLLTKKSV